MTGTKYEEPSSGFRGSALHASRAQTPMLDWLSGKRNKGVRLREASCANICPSQTVIVIGVGVVA